ncbi:immunoglobulin-like domain-containing protein [Cutibacterium sp.]|uniref:immunoglobulin-like domain-containing protein n=1 Tax=Cutibacterium sp. TaxID=1912221 RepID=UPI0026DD226D|nr:immunoglobulin-like domain-containing protein [Cutibacterium sp.]MDO4412292.1 DUF5011 domain-containing protein [Cutibacterium sp.]
MAVTVAAMAGISATDNLDGDITNITVSGNINTSKVGTYKVTYRVTDKAGTAASGERNVTVVEKTPAPSPSGSATASPSGPATLSPSGSTTSSPIGSVTPPASAPDNPNDVTSTALTMASSNTATAGGTGSEKYRPAILPRTGV